jgi:drug/metabolite transporter (DMT)-like permease
MKKRNLTLLILVSVMWSGQFTATKIGLRQFGPLTMVSFPMVLCVVLVAFFLRRGAKENGKQLSARPTLTPATCSKFLLVGVLGLAVPALVVCLGLRFSLASTASILALSSPIFSTAWAVILLGERMTTVRWLSSGLAVCGAVLVTGASRQTLAGVTSPYFFGNLLIILGCCGSGFYNVYSKRLLARFTELEVLFGGMLVGAIVLLPIALIEEWKRMPHLAELRFETITSVLYVGVLSYTVGMLIFFRVIRRIDVIVAALSTYLMSIFGVLIACITLHEKLSLSVIAGGVLVAAGTVIVTLYDVPARSAAKSES